MAEFALFEHILLLLYFHGAFFTPELGPAVVDPLAKFKQYSFIHSRNIEGGLNFF